MQNFGGYMLETGAALWSMGEHYRYTRDDEWVKQIEPKLLKACEFMLKWRQRNQHDDLRGRGYDLMEGKVAGSLPFLHGEWVCLPRFEPDGRDAPTRGPGSGEEMAG